MILLFLLGLVGAQVLAFALPPSTSVSQFSPKVAFNCGYRNQYLSKNGEWISDADQNAVCLKGKLDILKYCRRSYPDLDITNIVESSHNYQIQDWCKAGGEPCKWSFWVKPYRCIVGDFESEALLVPEGCHFGHVDDRTVCRDFSAWNATAHRECSLKNDSGGRSMMVRSFSILEPCGLDIFSGVEYVCCPRKEVAKVASTGADQLASHVKASIQKDTGKPEQVKEKVIPGKDDDWWDEAPGEEEDEEDEEDDDEYDDEDEESDEDEDDYSYEDEEDELDDVADSVNDPYLRLADPDNEHDRFKAATKRLQQRHKQKVAKVMNEWSELETRYQDMKTKDPKRAETFRKEMTERFQKTVGALEEETREERKQLDEVHQQRIRASLNERKRENIKAYRDAMGANTSAHTILKALESYIRAEEKDRLHNLNHYRHLLRSDPNGAEAFQPTLLKRLADMDTRVNATIDMLTKVPELMPKIKPVALEYWQSYRLENTPEIIDEPLIWIGSTDNNQKVLDKFVEEAETVKNEEAAARNILGGPGPVISSQFFNSDIMPPQPASGQETVDQSFVDNIPASLPSAMETVIAADADDFRMDQDEGQFAAHAMKDTQQMHAIVHETSPESTVNSSTILLAVGGAACMVAVLLGLVILRRKHSARGQGFIEVDPCTPEERHVATMQVNGFENPTYKYLEKA